MIQLCFYSPERKCVNGKNYNDGCNNCFCSNGHVACTMMACMDETGKMLPVIEAPDDFWEPQRFVDPPVA